jgi:hypothetical protein
VVTSTVQVLLQSVASWGNLVGGSERNSRRTERQIPIRRLIWIWLLNRLTRIALRGWLDWLSSCSLQRRLNWLTSSALRRGLDGLAPSALWRRLDWLAS